MYEEPQAFQRQIDVHFAKVGSNIRISREITSLAFSLEKETTGALAPILNEYIELIQIIFYQHIQREKDMDFQPIKTLLEDPIFDENQQFQSIQVDLEKIVFELEALKAFRG
ncbi:hypothetical protein D3C86_1582550 [compost metagenome]